MLQRNMRPVMSSLGHLASFWQGILEGTGKQMRHIKIYQVSDIEDKNVANFIKQLYSLE